MLGLVKRDSRQIVSYQCDIGVNPAENLAREFPQVVPATFTNARKEQWAVDFKILLQRREVALPKDRKTQKGDLKLVPTYY